MMSLKTNTFAKIFTLIILLLLPIIMLYTMSYRVSVNTLKEEIEQLKMQDLAFYANDLHTQIENISTLSFLLSEDIHVLRLQHLHLFDHVYDKNQEKLRLMERLRLLNVSGDWDVSYSIIIPASQDVVSTNIRYDYDLSVTQEIITTQWNYVEDYEQRFVRHIIKPDKRINDLEDAGVIIEATFSRDSIIRSLDTFKIGGKGDPFIYQPGQQVIANKTAHFDIIQQVIEQVEQIGLHEINKQVISIDHSEYLVTYMLVPLINWHLIDYVPLEEIIQPIVTSRNLFYGSVGLLLIMSVLIGYLLYRNVQRPIGLLIRGVQRLRLGDYSARITAHPNNEFAFLFRRFNEMTAEIERLIEKVYKEEIHAKELKLKQLQSQINPHFLYNSFALIRSLTRLDKKESVMNLTLHLSKYYRYTTRLENTTATLKEELQSIESYLEIQKLHIQHLSYEIHVPEDMMLLEVPRLMLQPIVENATLHGIASSETDGMINITGMQNDTTNHIIIADNGVGMTNEQIKLLTLAIATPPTEDTGYALWNVRERILLQFGDEATISFAQGKEEGLIATITWPREQETRT